MLLISYQANPNNRQLLAPVIQSLLILGRTAEVDATVSNAVAATPKDVTFLRDMINFYATQGRIPQALEIAKTLEKAQPDQWDVPFTIAKYELITGHREAAFTNIQRAVQLGGNTALQQIAREQIFQQVAQDPGFQQALKADQDALSTESSHLEQTLMKSIQEASSKQQNPKNSSHKN